MMWMKKELCVATANSRCSSWSSCSNSAMVRACSARRRHCSMARKSSARALRTISSGSRGSMYRRASSSSAGLASRGRPAGAARPSATGCTNVPLPRTLTTRPSDSSCLSARRTVPREMPNCSASARSAGSRAPGGSAPLASCSPRACRNRLAACEPEGAKAAAEPSGRAGSAAGAPCVRCCSSVDESTWLLMAFHTGWLVFLGWMPPAGGIHTLYLEHVLDVADALDLAPHHIAVLQEARRVHAHPDAGRGSRRAYVAGLLRDDATVVLERVSE